MITIKQLTPADWKAWKDIRLEAVRLHPEAFSGAYEEEVKRPDTTYEATLATGHIFAAYIDDEIAGIAGFSQSSKIKLQHRGTLYSMYVKDAYRGQGVSGALVKAVIAFALQQVQQLHCTVVTSNAAALKLYQKYGFVIYGTEPRSLKVGESYHDEYLMVLKFD